jgi:phosphoglycolate phosphatase
VTATRNPAPRPPRRPLLVGFDLDMTLIDSREGVAATFVALNAELGTTIDGDDLANRLGPTLETEMAAYFPDSEIPAVCNRYRELYADLGPRGSSLLPGAAEALEAVRACDGRIAVVTAKFEPNAHRCLDAVGLAADHVVGWRHGPQKGETLRDLGAAVYVGDTPPDIDAARIASAVGIGVATGPWTTAQLLAAGADLVLDSLLGFPGWLDTWLDRGGVDHAEADHAGSEPS